MEINPRFLEDSDFVAELELCHLRLMKDGDLDWFMMIPKVEGAREWIDLSAQQQIQLTKEIDLVSRKLKSVNSGKINIGSLGNVVSDLHIHVLSREVGDRAWPGPIWGTKSLKQYSPDRLVFWKKEFNS